MPPQEEAYTSLYFYMPKFKGVPQFNAIYLNGQQVFAVTSKSRHEYRFVSEGVLQVSNAKNVRTRGASSVSINIAGGGTHYIKIDRKGKLSLMTNNTIAKAEYEDSGTFSSSPIVKTEDRILPIPGMSIAREIERRTALAELEKLKLQDTKEEIEAAIEEYFDELKEKEELNDNIKPKIEVSVEKGKIGGDGYYQYNLRTSYSYDYKEDQGISAELINYPSGSYLLETSKAALATANAMKESIDRYLYRYFEPGSIIKIRIVGSADSSPIRTALPYKGEYSSIAWDPYYLTDSYNLVDGEYPSIDSLKIEPPERVNDSTQQAESLESAYGEALTPSIKDNNAFSTNEDLAYLRAKGIQQFIEAKVSALKSTKNEYLFQVKIEDGRGGNFRKVVIEILIEDILRDK